MKLGEKAVFKYTCEASPHIAEVEMLRDAEILCVQSQRDKIAIWARIVIGRSSEKRQFSICHTGAPCPGFDHRYLGTAFFESGNYVLHVFDLGEQTSALRSDSK